MDRFLTECVHPDYEFHTNVQVPSIPSVVRGHDELRAWIRQWYQDPWEEQLRMEVALIEELADGRVLALLTLRPKGRGSGVPVDTEYAHILTFHEGLGIRVDGFPTWSQALRAAGLAATPVGEGPPFTGVARSVVETTSTRGVLPLLGKRPAATPFAIRQPADSAPCSQTRGT